MATANPDFEPNSPERDMLTQSRDPFGLAALPELQPAQDGWTAIAAGLQQRRRRTRNWIAGLAIAATVTLAVGAVSLLPQLQTQPGEMPAAADTMTAQLANGQEPGQVVASKQAPGEPAEESVLTQPDNLLALQKLSRRLEQNLRYLRTGVGAMPAEMVVYQVELEDLVAQVDDAISQHPESSELWQQRVSLLMDLNQIYGAGLRRDEPYIASL